MPKFAAKALITALTARRARQKQPGWDRVVILSSTVVTIALVALFVYGKATSRW
jgi:hypothetical protein